MSDAVIVAIITSFVSLIGIFVQGKATRDKLTNKLDTNQQIMNCEIGHVKTEMSELKSDVKTHNHYAQLFNENIPVIKEQIKVQNHRIDDLEKKVG